MLFARSPVPATKQKRSPRLCSEETSRALCNSGNPGCFSINLQPLGLSIAQAWHIYIYHFSLAGNTVTTPVFSESCFSFPFSTHFIQLFLSSGDKELAVRGKKKNSCDFKEELFFLISCLYFSIIVWSCLKQLKAWLILLKGCGTSAFRMGLPWNGVGCQDLVFQYPEAVCSICGDGDWNF